MTDTPATDTGWMDAVPIAGDPVKPVAKPKGKVTPLRPLSKLAADLDNAPIAAVGKPKAAPEGDRGGDGGPDQGGDPGPDLDPQDNDLPPPDAPPGRPPKPPRPQGEIWEDCPVKPLGVNGADYFYLDPHGQQRRITKHDAQNIMMLFGKRLPALYWHFPKWNRDPDSGAMTRKPDHFDHQTATSAMIQACSEKGLFDPDSAVRGVGAWADDDGQLVYHAGSKLYIGATEVPPGAHQGKIYPAAPTIPHPAAADKDRSDPVPAILDTLNTWKWARGEVDAQIALGTIGVQAFGGALDWRPAYWITGGAGSGKSALQRLILHIHGGDTGIVQSTDPTARGIASQLGQSTKPVALDELEPGDAGSSKERDIIATARVAASGGKWLRGSSDQRGSSGQLRSTFLFSSILIPGILKSQDLQRIIVLSLDPLPDGAKPPDMRADTWRKRGAALKRLILDRWPTWADRLELWRAAFAVERVTGRDGDNWATTFAMAQMVQNAAMPTAEEMAGWVRRVAAEIRANRGEAGNDATEVVTHLLSQEYDVFRRGERYTLAQWVQVAAGSPGAPPGLLNDFGADLDGKRQRSEAANRHLAKAMIKVVAEGRDPPRLFIGNKPVQSLLNLFDGSQWAGGAWTQSLKRIPGALVPDRVRTLAGVGSRGVEVPLSALEGIMDGPDTIVSAQTRDVPVNSLPDDMEGFV
ncbi:MAG: hypothetical protein V4712_15200 [Pseudomonadota bacterium]